ncbi:cytochrome C [Novimethylophilus kurashikiensis]|uniref:Cytochrome C n=1 Tax=Novimethylophilus kurashikiensis TaxID=1825523 RepID=A0A2R5FCA0_9PROT|nr:cytochrome c [Novimethylophilus kurashikiensis]GBG15842.1 cytochrome C [Novimethylophilus kurashikiensis]
MKQLRHQLKLATMLGLLVAGLAGAFQNALALDAAGEGRRAWLKYNCYGCHGMRAGGGMGPAIAGEGEEIYEAVTYGKGEGMPAYGTLVNGTEIANMATYLRSINSSGEPMFLHWWELVPTQ